MDELVGVLSDHNLVLGFGGAAFARGVSYFREGRVDGLQQFPTGVDAVSVFARVDGTGPESYVVRLTVRWSRASRSILSSCTCPVVERCKHAVAVALAVRHEASLTAASAEPAWRSQLSALLGELDGDDSAGSQDRAVALEFLLRRGSRGYGSQTRRVLHLRPRQAGTAKPWIKTGVRWADLPRAVTRHEHQPDQIRAVAALHAALITTGAWWSNIDDPALTSFGPRVWSLLAEAQAAGVTMLAGGELGGVTVLDRPVSLEAQVSQTEGGIEVRTGVRYDERGWFAEDLMPIGRPPHGVVLVEERAPVGRQRLPRVHVTLAALDRRLPETTAELLLAPEAIKVPTADAVELTETFLPRLARHLRLRSPDGTVAVPDTVRPRLTLVVVWSGVSAQTHWAWTYGSERVAADAADQLGGLRDRGTERALWAALSADGVLPRLAPMGGSPRDPGSFTWAGAGAVELATSLLPVLREHPEVDVVESDEPDFRAAVGEVEISFDATPHTDPTSSGDLRDWLDLQVNIRVDDEQIPLSEVLSALTLGHELIILPSGLHVPADRPEFRRLGDLVQAAGELAERSGDQVSVGRRDLGLWAQLADLGVVDQQAAEWVRQARALRDLTELPTPDPVGVTSTLRSYQLAGFHWLAFLFEHGLGGILADDMGLGKTLQVLSLISHARTAGSGRFLVVAPTSVVSAWQSEAARHTPGLKVTPVTASYARRGQTIAELSADTDVVVTTYTLLRLEREQYADVGWGGLILDEAQHVKNHQGKTYQAIRTVTAPFKLAVTGTPFENRLLELWSLLSITAPGLYPWPAKFVEQVAGPVEKQGDEAALRRFRERIKPFLLRRTKDLVAADLPAKQEQVLQVQLSPRHRRIYDTHLAKERQKVLGLVGEFDRNRVAIFSSLTRLRQLSLDPGLVEEEHRLVGSAKLDTLVEHLTECTAEGHRALVFSQFTSFLTLARDRLEAAGIETAYLDGKTRRRGEVIESFRAGSAPVFLISLKAGGVGLTLTEADYVFVLDPWWNPAAEAQAVDRAHRIGQTRSVLVYRLVASDTIEEKVMALKARKAELFAQVIEGDGAMSTALSAEDIRELFG